MKEEEDSREHLDPKEVKKSGDFKVKSSISKDYGNGLGFDPFDQLQIQVNKSDRTDRQELQKILGMYLCYPSTEFAELHAEAMRLGNYDLQNKEDTKSKMQNKEESQMMEQNRHVCPCCGFVCQQDTIKFCTSFNDIKNMGTSTFLYFYTFKNLSLLLAIMAVVYGIFAIITNVLASNASVNDLYTLDYIKISLAAKQNNPTDTNKLYYFIQCWLGLATILIWFMVIIGIKYLEIKRSIEYDEDTSSASDFSIVLEGMPLDATKEELQTQLNAYYDNVIEYEAVPEKKRKPFKIASFNVGKPFYLHQSELESQELQNIEKEVQELKEKFREWIQQRQSSPNFSEPKANREAAYKRYEELVVKKMEKNKEALTKMKKQLAEEKGDQLTAIFVTLDTNLAQNLICDLNEVTIYSRLRGIFGDKTKFSFQRGDKTYSLSIARAPEPEDIIWTNIGVDDCSKYIRKFVTYSLTAVLLGISFGIVYGLQVKQNDFTVNNPNDAVSRYLSIAISLVIALINVLIVLLVKFLTKFQRDYTTTNFQASLAIKAIMAQMINSILIPIIVARYIKKNIYQASGLADNTFMMSFSIALVAPLVVVFDPLHFMTKFLRCWKRRQASKFYQDQSEHNAIHEGIEFQVGYEYIYVVNLFMFVCFYISLQPICVFAAMLGYLFMYWAQKYSIFYRYRRPVPATDFINQAVYQFIHFGPLLYSLGSLTWSNFMPNGIPENALIPNIIALCVSVLIFIIPVKLILIGCCFDEETLIPTDYEEERIAFSTEYDRLNPVTHEEAAVEYYKYCEKYAENFKKLSHQKQAKLAKKKKNNQAKGQLNNMHQQSSQPPALGIIGGKNTANLFASLIKPQNQQQINPYQLLGAFNFSPQGQAPAPAANPLGALIAPPQPQRHSAIHVMPQAQNNAFAAMFAPQPQPMMGGMQPMMNPINQMFGPGSRMY